MVEVCVYDTKPYDRDYLGPAGEGAIHWRFHEFRLTADTAGTVTGAGIICAFVNDRLDDPCLAALQQLGVKLIALRCAGFNQVDLAAARRREMRVVRVPSYSPHAVAEHAVALLLTLNRKIHRAYQRVREHNFSLNGLVGFDIHGKTVGIVGTGKIGRIAAQILRGFGAEVLAHDPFPDAAWAGSINVSYTTLHELLKRSDIVSLHLPLSVATHHLIDEASLALMKPGAFLINTSRGKLVDTAALIKVLKKGAMRGVALDVYEEEEGIFFEDFSDRVLPDDHLSRLLSFPNVLVTSHQAFLTAEALHEIARVTSENILRFHRGESFLPDTCLV